MLPGRPADDVRAAHLPTAILGDLDSIRPDVLGFYRARGVEVRDLSGAPGRCAGGLGAALAPTAGQQGSMQAAAAWQLR